MTRTELQRTQMQRDKLLDQLQTRGHVETFGCGHPRVDFNMYRNDGKQYCRMCRAERQSAWRRAEIEKRNASTCNGVRELTTQARS